MTERLEVGKAYDIQVKRSGRRSYTYRAATVLVKDGDYIGVAIAGYRNRTALINGAHILSWAAVR